MTKASLKPSSTEIVIAGQPSAALVAELKAAGEKLTVKQLATSLAHVEAARVGFVVEAIATGILLLAKKQTFGHGDWQPFCAEVWREIKPTGNGVSHSPDALHNFVRSLRHYTFLGQHFLADLEQGNFQPDGEAPAKPLGVRPAEVLALDTLPQDKRIAVYGAIETWVAGRSLRRILIDFRRAESAAEQEEIEEEDRRRKKKTKPADPAQLDFFQDMLRPIEQIDALFDDKTFVKHTDKAFWNGVADKLETQARKARAMAREIAS